jgi:hypothetical protein
VDPSQVRPYELPLLKCADRGCFETCVGDPLHAGGADAVATKQSCRGDQDPLAGRAANPSCGDACVAHGNHNKPVGLFIPKVHKSSRIFRNTDRFTWVV